jgi:Transcriptional regulator, AbiEi antitoxin
VQPTLRARAEARLGLFSTAEALAAGYDAGEIRALCRRGLWVRLRRGVLTTAESLAAQQAAGRRFDVDCLAVLLSVDRPSALVSHSSAARLWELPVPTAADTIIRLTDPQQWRRGDGYLMTCAPVFPGQRWRAGPVRLTSVARTLIDCAREWPLEDAVVAMDAALLANRMVPADLAAAVNAVRRWRGAGRAARAVNLADGRAESPLETRGRLRLIGAGLAPDNLQVEIRVDGRLVAVADAWYEEAAVAIEFDGRIKYTDPWRGRSPERVLWEEKQREDEVRALDIGVARIVDADVYSRWPATEAQVRRLLGRAGPTERRFTATPRERGVRRTG